MEKIQYCHAFITNQVPLLNQDSFQEYILDKLGYTAICSAFEAGHRYLNKPITSRCSVYS